jgi:hypothetical protein
LPGNGTNFKPELPPGLVLKDGIDKLLEKMKGRDMSQQGRVAGQRRKAITPGPRSLMNFSLSGIEVPAGRAGRNEINGPLKRVD